VRLLAIDPGPTGSELLIYDTETAVPVHWAHHANKDTLTAIDGCGCEALAVEMVASYGMPVGAEVFMTCVWIGRFVERWNTVGPLDVEALLIPRIKVRSYLCHSAKAGDSNVRQALIDRYGPGKEKAIGLKASPGPLYGLTGHAWAALGLAITALEHHEYAQLTLDAALEQA
jgi:hypothetical protein